MPVCVCSPVLRYFFPRQLLIPHFWTPKQHLEFRALYNSLRAQHHRPVLTELERSSVLIKNAPLMSRLKDLCVKVRKGHSLGFFWGGGG